MAKPITRWQTIDGSVFNTEAEANAHDALRVEIAAILAPLGPLPDDTDFANGGGYLPHDPADVARAKAALCAIAARTIPWFREHEAKDIHPMSFAGRLLDDCGPSLLRSAWDRLACTDDRGREWGQPYYALHPTAGTQREWAQVEASQ